MKIPVKKSDGSTVFLTMDEFREYKKKAVAPVVPVASPISSIASPASSVNVNEVKQSLGKIVTSPSAPHDDSVVKPKKLEQGKVETISLPEPEIATPVVPVAPITLPVVALPLVLSTETELATTTPVTEIFVDEAKAKAPEKKIVAPPVVLPPKADKHDGSDKQPDWKTSDHESLLESDITEEKKSLPALAPASSSDSATAILAKVKEQFSVPISKDIEGRFDSLVLSRIRDVRSVLDFEQYAKETKEKGGLGFEEDQVGLLLAIIAAAQKIAAPKIAMAPELPRNDSESKTPGTVPASSVTMPVSASGGSEAKQSDSGIRITPVMSPQFSKVSAPSPFPIPKEEYSFSPPAKPQNNKALMQDVTPSPRKQTIGPVDEIQYFSLTDFRRLSPKVESAKEILKGKFQSLQEESYVLFLDARDAWHESPLFRLYQETILHSLEEKKILKDALAQKTEGLSHAELDAIVEINHYLG